ncbi:MAG: peptidoglycan-binding protein [Symplocastrum torsivum CPER-KK1]|jgi:peptidoglycan hydrolase-like protein with peptidoglycan-binding domain|uniref:Peptidoglycan-binding protein n=1 Tax=Symplocastrum torsivum CPER-KK1 TaxID=450513 RepID=A0A951PRR5_9CYAN|nr:peptidoglycan-binding protein [Symplocastrum torsivum CPER-KK1]
METLAYTHLTAIYEEPTDLKTLDFELKLFKNLNRSKLPAKASMRFLSLTLALIVMGISSSAFALERGNSGSQVSTLQRNLTIAGYYNGPVTGFYGSLTQDAVTRFQRANGLTPDGIAGSRTLASLEGRGGPITGGGFSNVTLKRGNSGTSITRLQQALTNYGYYNGPITGYFGKLTESAVIKFQRANGLVADGIVGQRTKAALAAD